MKDKQWLRPCERVQLAGCAHVPLRWRRLYVLASYLYLRPGGLRPSSGATCTWPRATR